MKLRTAARVWTIVAATLAACGRAEARPRTRNVILFVADGLRPSSLNQSDAPTLVRLRNEGVFFANSHSIYPTVTTANASAIATGHQLGDTGNFANALYDGAQVLKSGTPFIEDDEVLMELDAQTGGNYLGEKTLLAVARAEGFSTAAIGKLGPTLIQDVSQGDRSVKLPATIFIDDRTGSGRGVPLDPAIAALDVATVQIDRQVGVGDDRRLFEPRAPQRRVQPRGQLRHLERFRDVVVGAAPQPGDPVVGVGLRAEHQDRRLGDAA